MGVGINDADYKVQLKHRTLNQDGLLVYRNSWVCPFYQKWASMLSRCYSPRIQKLQPSYCNVSVCKEWLTFSNFKKWMEKQDWEGKELDKDLLFRGNLIYSPETCVFLDKPLNLFLSKDPIVNREVRGVTFDKRTGKYRAQCSNPFTGKNEYLGLFDSPEEGSAAYMNKKYEFAAIFAEYQTDERVSKAILSRYKLLDERYTV